jgi:hypothetical protein
VATYGTAPSFGYAGQYRYYADASSQLGKCPKPFNWKCAAYSAGVGALTGCAGKWVTGDAIEDIMMKVMLKLFGMDIGSACNNSYPVTWPPTKGF